MPKSQVASIANYDFGAPAAEGVVLKFRVKGGGKLGLRFENADGVNDVEVTVQVSPDDSTWSDTTAAGNIVAVANESIQKRTFKDFTILLRQGQDAYMRVQAVGGARAVMQVRDSTPGLEIVLV